MTDLDYTKIKIKQLSEVSDKLEIIYRKVAIYFAKTGFYRDSIKVNRNLNDPYERIIEVHIRPNINNISIILYEGQLIGFFYAHLLTDIINRQVNNMIITDQINWKNHGNILYDFYEVYFTNGEFIFDNIALEDDYQNKGIYSNIIYPILLKNAIEYNASSIVLAVFKYQNYKAYELYLKQGFKQIASLKFELEEVILPNNEIILSRKEEMILLRLTI